MKGFGAPLWYRLNSDGSTTGVDDPAEARQPFDEKRVARETVRTGKRVWRFGKLRLRFRPHDVDVSTVFLSLDHAFDNGPPILFETMVFGGKYDLECQRYATFAEAKAGHARVVQALRAGRNPWDES